MSLKVFSIESLRQFPFLPPPPTPRVTTLYFISLTQETYETIRKVFIMEGAPLWAPRRHNVVAKRLLSRPAAVVWPAVEIYIARPGAYTLRLAGVAETKAEKENLNA